jgi:folate-binding protein YgfZ
VRTPFALRSLKPAAFAAGSLRTPMNATSTRVASRPRDYVAVRGPDAGEHLQALLTNDVEKLLPGDASEGLLLTPKARVIAPLVVLRRGADDYLLLTEPGLGERVRTTLLRARFAKRCEIELEVHSSAVVLAGEEGIPTADYGVPAVELLDGSLSPTMSDEELELLRIRAGTPRFGRELDDRVLPAEAGLDERAIDFEKGCYPGQEPVARQRYRGRVNRTLRVLELDGPELPGYDAELSYDGKAVGRITSAVRDDVHVIALGYIRVEVPRDATLDLAGRAVRQPEPQPR